MVSVHPCFPADETPLGEWFNCESVLIIQTTVFGGFAGLANMVVFLLMMNFLSALIVSDSLPRLFVAKFGRLYSFSAAMSR